MMCGIQNTAEARRERQKRLEVGASDPDRENFEPNRYSGLRKEISVILPRAFGFRQPEVVGPPRTTDAGARVTGRDTRVLPFRAASGLAGGEIRKLRIMPP